MPVFRLPAINFQPCVTVPTGRGGALVGSLLDGSDSVQAAGCKLLTICNACYTFSLAGAVLQLAQSGLAVIVSRLPAPNCQPSVMPAKVCEVVLQMILSWLAVAVPRLPAANNQPLLMSAVLFTLAVAALQLALAGSGSFQAAGCGIFRFGIHSNPAGIFLAGSVSIQAAAGTTMVCC